MTKTLVIWGAGGHGRAVADVARSIGFSVIEFIDRDPETVRIGRSIKSIPITRERDFLERSRERLRHSGIALGIGLNAQRMECLAQLHDQALPALIHPSAWVSPSARIGRGTIVFPNVVVNTDAQIGDGVIINTGAIIEHDCCIADGAHVSTGAVLAGGVAVEVEAWIGAGATIIPGITIGHGSIVGAGAVVIRDVGPRSLVAGVPSRLVRTLS